MFAIVRYRDSCDEHHKVIENACEKEIKKNRHEPNQFRQATVSLLLDILPADRVPRDRIAALVARARLFPVPGRAGLKGPLPPLGAASS